MHGKCPTTLQEAKPKAGSVRSDVLRTRTADGSEAQKSNANHPRPDAFADLTFPQAFGHPDENESGRTSGENDTWARTSRNAERDDRGASRANRSFSRRTCAARPPADGSKPAKGLNPMSAAGRHDEGRTQVVRPGREGSLG